MKMREQIFAGLFLILTLVFSIAAREGCQMSPETLITYTCVQATLDDIVNLYKHTEQIEFTVSKLPCIPQKAFASFSLRTLIFSNCDIRCIHPDAFLGLGHLERLTFYGSNVNVIRASWFKDLRSLTHLSLEKNNIVYIESELFLQIPKLETLNIVDNDLDCLPKHALAPLRKLKSFFMGKNPWLCSCYEDLHKWMDYRNISSGEEKHSKYECMMDYSTESHQLGSKSYMREWTASNNKGLIERYKNYSMSLSDSSGICTSILSDIPNNVESIELSGITISKIPEFAFLKFGNNLRSLNFTNCHITDIEPTAFAGLPKLEQLILQNNTINTVKYQWFRDFRVLRHLELNSNGIEHVQLNGFVELDKLETFSLNHNKIKCLDENSFSLLRNLKKINILGNPWTCECLNNFKRWLDSNEIGVEVGKCIETQGKVSEHEYGLESGNNSTGQIFGNKLIEINHYNTANRNGKTESEHERHEIKSGSEYHVNSAHQQEQYSQHTTLEKTITQHEHHMQQQQQEQQHQYSQQEHSQRLTQEKTIRQHEQSVTQQQQQQQQLNRRSRRGVQCTTPVPVDRTTVQGNSSSPEGNPGSEPQKLFQGNCMFNGNVDNTYICIGGDLLLLEQISDTADRIEISNSTILKLPASAFARFKNLKKLHFHNCSIQTIDSLAFNGLQKLESLILTGNNIPIIKSAWFDQLSSLTELRLANNSITDIEAGVFQKLPNLMVLSLQGNSITIIYTKSINHLNKLKEVSFENNPWKWRCACILTQFLEERNITHTKIENCQGKAWKTISCTMEDEKCISGDGSVGKGTTNTSISTVNVICISIAMLIFTKI